MTERARLQPNNLNLPKLSRRSALLGGLGFIGLLAVGGLTECINQKSVPTSPEINTHPIGKEIILPIKEYDTFGGVLYVDDKNAIFGEAITMAIVPTQDDKRKLFWFATFPTSSGVYYPAYLADIVSTEGDSFTATTEDGWIVQVNKTGQRLTGTINNGKQGKLSGIKRDFSVSPREYGKNAVRKNIQEVLSIGFRNLSEMNVSDIYTKPIEDLVGYQNWPVNP